MEISLWIVLTLFRAQTMPKTRESGGGDYDTASDSSGGDSGGGD